MFTIKKQIFRRRFNVKLIILNFSPIDSLRINNYLRKTPVFYTKISSVGGIVSSGSYTYLIKVNDELLEEYFLKVSPSVFNCSLNLILSFAVGTIFNTSDNI